MSNEAAVGHDSTGEQDFMEQARKYLQETYQELRCTGTPLTDNETPLPEKRAVDIEKQVIEVETSGFKMETLPVLIETLPVEIEAPAVELETVAMKCETADVEVQTSDVEIKEGSVIEEELSPDVEIETPWPIWAEGPGLRDCFVGDQGYFKVFTGDAGLGTLSVQLKEPKTKARIKKWKGVKETVTCRHKPKVPGKYIIKIKWDDEHIIGSPFTIRVRIRPAIEIETPAVEVETSDVEIEERSIIKEEVPEVEIEVSAVEFETPTMEIETTADEIEAPAVELETVAMKCETADVEIQTADVEIKEESVIEEELSPDVEIETPWPIWTEGPGLRDCFVGDQGYFKVFAGDAGLGTLSVQLKEPKTKARIRKWKGVKETVTYTYNPEKAGKYIIKIKWDDEHIIGSPFTIRVRNRPAIEIETPAVGVETSDVEIEERSIIEDEVPEVEIEVSAVELETPAMEIERRWPAVEIETPWPVWPIWAEGPGLKDCFVGDQGYFQIFTGDAGRGTLSVQLKKPLAIPRLRKWRGLEETVTCRYNPDVAGKYIIKIKWENEHIIGSPFKIQVRKRPAFKIKTPAVEDQVPAIEFEMPTVETNKDETTGVAGCEMPTVETNKDETTGVAGCEMQALGDTAEAKIETLKVEAEEMIYDVEAEAVNIEETAVEVNLLTAKMEIGNAKDIRAEGPGLMDCFVGDLGDFQIFIKHAGDGILTVQVKGPKAKSHVSEWKGAKRAVTCRYNHEVAGKYTINIKWGDDHIKGSPFNIKVRERPDKFVKFETPAVELV